MLSIVLPTLNRAEYLLSTVESLLRQTFREFEIIVVDQSDVSLETFPVPDNRIINIRQVEKSASKARNTGLLAASGDIVLFLDDDILIDSPDFLSNHLRHYSNSLCPGVSGSILSAKREYRAARHPWSYKKRVGWLFFPINYSNQTSIGNGWAGNLSVRRDWAIDVGGMDEQYPKGAFREESDFCARLVRKYGNLIYDPEAYIVHIGAPIGGLRAFKSRQLIKAQHHFDGMFYFLFRNVRILDYPYHLISFFTIFFKFNVFIRKPVLFFVFIKRTLFGIWNACRKVWSGPKLLSRC